jgi:UrcA family protein
MLLRSFTTLATSIILALGITAARADDYSIVSTTVAFGDLNLAQPADDKILADRLQDAAKSVCLKANPDIGATAELQVCIDTAVSMAMVQVEDRLDRTVDTDLTNVRTSMESP